jgi:hypothetical protein
MLPPRINRALNEFSRFIDLGRAEAPANKRIAGVCGEDRQSPTLQRPIRTALQRPASSTRTVQATPMMPKSPRRRHFQEAGARARLGDGQLHLHQHLIVLTGRAERSDKKSDASIHRSALTDCARNLSASPRRWRACVSGAKPPLSTLHLLKNKPPRVTS